MNHRRVRFHAAAGLMAAFACAACSSGGKSDGNAGAGPAGSGPAGRGGAAGATTTGAAGSVGGGAAGAPSSGTAGAGIAGAPAAGTAGGAESSGGAGAGGITVASGGAGGGAAGATGGGWQSAFPTFVKHTIASFNSGYMTVIADVDHDGMPDVVALSSASDGLVWFKNPTWKKYTITTKAKAQIYCAPYDIDGDGDLDLAVASDFSMSDTTGGGTVSWAENPDDPTQTQDWTLHKIGAVPTSHRLRWGDIDGDGKKELLDLPIFGEGSMAPAYAGAVALTAFFIPGDPKAASAAWISKVIDNQHLEVAHGLMVVDWDGDKAQDILTAANDGVDLFRPALGKGAENVGPGATGQAPMKGSSEVGLGHLGGAPFIATIEPWHGTNEVIYTPGSTTALPWTRKDLGADFEHGHGMAVVDFNGDGYDEVVAGGGQGTMVEVIYRYVPSSGSWDKIKLDSGNVAVSGIDVGDLNGDGRPDIVAIGTSPTNNVVWYESTK